MLTNVHHPDNQSAESSSAPVSPRGNRAECSQRHCSDANGSRTDVGGVGVSVGGDIVDGAVADADTGSRIGSSPTPLSDLDDSVRSRSRGQRHERRRRGQQPNGHDTGPGRHGVSAANPVSSISPLGSRHAASHPPTPVYTTGTKASADESLPTSRAVSERPPDEYTAAQSGAGGFGEGRGAVKEGGNGRSAEDMLWAALDVVMFYAPWSVAALLGFQLWLIGLGREEDD